MVVYLGHNGLMDFSLPFPEGGTAANDRAAMVLCCKSEAYFREPLERAGIQPLLLTTKLMYPGSFILKSALAG